MNPKNRLELRIARVLTAASLLLAALLTAGCGNRTPNNDHHVTAQQHGSAEPSGRVTWYTLWSSVETKKVIDQFTKRYGHVRVIPMQFGSAEEIERIRAEYRSGVNAMDVVNIRLGRLYAKPLADSGILARYRPRVLDDYPPALAKRIFHAYWTVMAVDPHGICYNKSVVKAPPTSYESLLDPRFKGEIVMQTPLQIGGSRNFLIETRGYWGDQRWKRFWKGLAKQDIFFTEDPAQGMMLLTRGERGIYLYCNMSLYSGQIKNGAPLAWVTAAPNVASKVVIAMAKRSHNPTAAKAFYNFLMSRKGQETIASAFDMEPVFPNAKLPEAIKDAARVPIVFSPSEFQVKQLEKNPNAWKYYEQFAASTFGLR